MAKAREKPAYPPGLKPQRLTAGSSMSQVHSEFVFELLNRTDSVDKLAMDLTFVAMHVTKNALSQLCL